MPNANPTLIFNRQKNCIEEENVFQRRFMDLFYNYPQGRFITCLIWSRRLFSLIYGWWHCRKWTGKKIAPFVRKHHIDMSEVMIPSGGFDSFNDFFIRQLKPNARPVASKHNRLIAPADSRLQVFSTQNDVTLMVKGAPMPLERLLGTNAYNNQFHTPLYLRFRLAPCDYHRFAYVDDGIQGPVHTINGRLHSIHPIALQHNPNIPVTNFRQWCWLQTNNFRHMIQVEIGAMTVGSIIQHRPKGGSCHRGREKGYFALGGSTIVLILEHSAIEIDPDIVAYSQKGIETLVRMGEAVGRGNSHL